MALIFYFDLQGMSSEKYGEVINRLEAAGAGSPKGRSYHFSFGIDHMNLENMLCEINPNRRNLHGGRLLSMGVQ